MSDKNSASISLLVPSTALNTAVRKALHLYVGTGKRFTVKEVAAAAFGDAKHSWRIDCAKLPLDNENFRALPFEMVVSIGAVIGADFTNAWAHLMTQGAFDLPENEPDPGALAADNSDDNATVVRAAIDGEFDQQERVDLRVVGTRMMTRGAQLTALGAKAA